MGFLTDTGYVTDEALDLLPGVDFVILESNHDVESLCSGPYPYYLKQRILGLQGHLCNEDAAQFAVTLAENGASDIVLAHLSRDNNTPAMALNAVAAALDGAGLTPELSVAPRDTDRPVSTSSEGGPYAKGDHSLCTGKLKEKFYLDAAAEYVKRLSRFCKLEIIELPEERLPEDPSPPRSRRPSPEADAVRAKLPNGCLVIAMCGGAGALQRGAGPLSGGQRRPRRQPHRLSHRQLLRNARILEAASRSAAVHVPHDLSPPPAAGDAFGADLPGLPDQRRKQIP